MQEQGVNCRRRDSPHSPVTSPTAPTPRCYHAAPTKLKRDAAKHPVSFKLTGCDYRAKVMPLMHMVLTVTAVLSLADTCNITLSIFGMSEAESFVPGLAVS